MTARHTVPHHPGQRTRRRWRPSSMKTNPDRGAMSAPKRKTFLKTYFEGWVAAPAPGSTIVICSPREMMICGRPFIDSTRPP